MSKSVVVEWPKGVYTRLMPGSQAIELYEESRKGDKQKKAFRKHMEQLHVKFLEEQGRVETNR